MDFSEAEFGHDKCLEISVLTTNKQRCCSQLLGFKAQKSLTLLQVGYFPRRDFKSLIPKHEKFYFLVNSEPIKNNRARNEHKYPK